MRRSILLATVSLVLFSGLFLAASDVEAQNRRDRRRAENLVAEGDRLYRQRQYNTAILKYAEALAIVPRYPLAHYNKGLAHFNLDKWDEAIREFSIALDQGYDRQTVYSIRWRAYFNNQAYTEAMRDIQAGRGINPNNDYFYIAEGQVYHEQRQYQKAVDSFQNAVRLGTKNRNIDYLIALSCNGMLDYERQTYHARKATTAGTDYPDMAWFLLGDGLQRNREYEEAMRSYQNALTVNPDLYGVYVNLSETYRVQNRLKDAIETTLRGVEKYPNDTTLHINLSWYYSLADRHEESIVISKRAVQLGPNQYLGYTNLCRAYNDTAQYDLAIEACNQALRLQPGDGETYFYLGRAFQSKNDVNKAVEYYELAVKGLEVFTQNNLNYADGYYLLGNAYSVTNDLNSAERAYRQSLQIAPKFARARFNLGVVYIRKGELNLAREQHRELIELDAQLAKKLLEAIDS